MRTIRIFKQSGVALVGLALAFVSANANAAFVLTLDDLGTAGIDVIISDEQGAGFSTTVGATTDVDSFNGAGVLTYVGAAGGFSVNVTTGVSKPIAGQGVLDLNSLNVSGGSGTLRIGLTDTGFVDGVNQYQTHLGGTTDGSVDFNFLFDAANAEFGGSAFYDPAAFTAGAFSASQAAAVSGSPYSLTIFAEITHSAAAEITSFDAELSPVVIPLPGTAWLFVGGILPLLRTLKRS